MENASKMDTEPDQAPRPDAGQEPPAGRASVPMADLPGNPNLGMLCHLLSLSALVGVPLGNLLGPLILWLIKKDEDPFVDACGKESLNFQLSVMIYGFGLVLIAFPMALIPFVNLVFIPGIVLAFGVLAVGTIALVLVATVHSGRGAFYRYPLCLRFIR